MYLRSRVSILPLVEENVRVVNHGQLVRFGLGLGFRFGAWVLVLALVQAVVYRVCYGVCELQIEYCAVRNVTGWGCVGLQKHWCHCRQRLENQKSHERADAEHAKELENKRIAVLAAKLACTL